MARKEKRRVIVFTRKVKSKDPDEWHSTMNGSQSFGCSLSISLSRCWTDRRNETRCRDARLKLSITRHSCVTSTICQLLYSFLFSLSPERTLSPLRKPKIMSYRSDNGASYDRTLLSSVPDPTRAEKQVRVTIRSQFQFQFQVPVFQFYSFSPSSKRRTQITIFVLFVSFPILGIISICLAYPPPYYYYNPFTGST